jgi:hypothetical protein
MGIDPMNNISNNNKNTLCSYIILTRSTVVINPRGMIIMWLCHRTRIIDHYRAMEGMKDIGNNFSETLI